MEFDSLFQAHHKAVLAYLQKLVRDFQLAEDLCQETFVRALRAHRRGEEFPYARPWLLRVARNIACDASRRRELVSADSEKLEELPADEASVVVEGLAAESDRARMRRLLREGLGNLGEFERDLFERRYRKQMAYWEIALRGGSSVQSAKMRLFRGRKKLRKFIRSRMCDPRQLVVRS